MKETLVKNVTNNTVLFYCEGISKKVAPCDNDEDAAQTKPATQTQAVNPTTECYLSLTNFNTELETYHYIVQITTLSFLSMPFFV